MSVRKQNELLLGLSHPLSCELFTLIKLHLDNRFYDTSTVKHVLRGHLRKGQKLLLKPDDLLILIHLHYILIQGTQKMKLLKTGGIP